MSMARLSELFKNREYYFEVMSLMTLSNQLSMEQEQKATQHLTDAKPLPFCSEKTAPLGTSVINQMSYITRKNSDVTPANMDGAAQLFGLLAKGEAVSTSAFMAPTGGMFVQATVYGDRANQQVAIDQFESPIFGN